jgi:hypothetical protein
MKLSVPKPKPKSWLFALIVALVLGVLVLIDYGAVSTDAGLTSACRVEVTGTNVNVRTDPDVGGSVTTTLHRGDLRGAETTVRNGYRQLTGGGWAIDDLLRPLPGSKCAAVQ